MSAYLFLEKQWTYLQNKKLNLSNWCLFIHLFLFSYSFLDVCYNVYAFHFLLVNKNTDDKKKKKR